MGESIGLLFEIDVPPEWNHGLVIYSHGYSPAPVEYKDGPPDTVSQIFLQHGFAVAQSGFSSGGWSIKEGLEDNARLLARFTNDYSKPSEIYVAGHSLGGFLTLALMETSPESFDGGLVMCSPLGPANWFLARRVFDFNVLFDYYFPGILSFPDPSSGAITRKPLLTNEIVAAISANPNKTKEVLRFGASPDPKNSHSRSVYSQLFWMIFIAEPAEIRSTTGIRYTRALRMTSLLMQPSGASQPIPPPQAMLKNTIRPRDT